MSGAGPDRVHYRPARAEDIEPAQALVVRSINDLTERHGFGPIASQRPAQFQLFSLRDDPDGLWIAESGGETVGFAFSWVCGELWFLAELFISPAHQGHGIGNELLRRTSEQGRKSGASVRALITFPFNLVSQALYIRHGMFPRLPIYNVGINRETLAGRLSGPRLQARPLEDNAAHLGELKRIDSRVLGASREKHHRFLIHDSATRALLLHSGSDCVGYAYIGPTGHIGPLAVINPAAADAAFRTALGVAADSNAPQVSAFIPGSAQTILGAAVGLGMRMALPMVLASTRDFGDWTRYLPRNPGFM